MHVHLQLVPLVHLLGGGEGGGPGGRKLGLLCILGVRLQVEPGYVWRRRRRRGKERRGLLIEVGRSALAVRVQVRLLLLLLLLLLVVRRLLLLLGRRKGRREGHAEGRLPVGRHGGCAMGRRASSLSLSKVGCARAMEEGARAGQVGQEMHMSR